MVNKDADFKIKKYVKETLILNTNILEASL